MALYGTYTDEQLVGLLREGDEMALAEIFDRYNKLLYSHVFNKLRQESDARDVVQEVFIKLWEKRSRLTEGNLAGYLFTLARNRVLNVVSHNQVVQDYRLFVQRYGKGFEEGVEDLVLSRELSNLIEAEISALPPRMREVFNLSRKGFLSNKEIADRLGLSEHTVADHIKKSLRVLRVRIGLLLVIGYIIGR